MYDSVQMFTLGALDVYNKLYLIVLTYTICSVAVSWGFLKHQNA